MDLTKDQLWDLRKQVSLNSLYYSDFRNDFGIEEHACSAFFDGWLDYMQEMMVEDGHTDAGDKFFDYIDEYDNPDFLWDWYLCHDEDCFPIDKVWVSSEMKDEAENNLIELVYSKKFQKSKDQYGMLNDCIMKVVVRYEEEYPELKNEPDGEEKWYDEDREDLLNYYEKYVE